MYLFLQTVERFLSLQQKKAEQCSALRLRYVRARNAVSELQTAVTDLEKIGSGLYVAQYEQLCIDHQNLVSKIEGKHCRSYLYFYRILQKSYSMQKRGCVTQNN